MTANIKLVKKIPSAPAKNKTQIIPILAREIKDGYEASGKCIDCNGVTHYQLKPKDCGPGFTACDNGPEIGAQECKSGEDVLYSNCKANCSAEYNLSSCPAHVVCEECDGKYKPTGCAANYIDEEKYWNGE